MDCFYLIGIVDPQCCSVGLAIGLDSQSVVLLDTIQYFKVFLLDSNRLVDPPSSFVGLFDGLVDPQSSLVGLSDGLVDPQSSFVGLFDGLVDPQSSLVLFDGLVDP